MIKNTFFHSPAATCSLASGSSGNAIYFQSASTKVLVDCGISCKRICAGLNGLEISPEEISAVLVTHEHSDHISGLEVFARRHKLPIYMSAGTYREWSARVPRAVEHDVHLLQAGQKISLADLEVEAFSIPHDAAEPLGFSLNDGRHKVSVFTDLGQVTDDLLRAVAQSRLIYIEANYDPNMLWAGSYPWELKQRIAGEKGHLSNTDAAEAIADLLSEGCEEYVLSHLSVENNMPALADLTVQQVLLSKNIKVGEDLRLRLAPRYEAGPMVYL